MPESDESNNLWYWEITITAPPVVLADLSVVAGFLYPTNGIVYPGMLIQMSLNVKNVGAGPAGGYRVYFYFKQSALVFENNYRIADVPMPALPKDSVMSTGTITYQIPNILPGTYSLYYLIDATFAVNESIEWNNDGAWPLTVNSAPDLDRTGARFNDVTHHAGDKLTFDVDIINAGGSSSLATAVYYYFKKDTCQSSL